MNYEISRRPEVQRPPRLRRLRPCCQRYERGEGDRRRTDSARPGDDGTVEPADPHRLDAPALRAPPIGGLGSQNVAGYGGGCFALQYGPTNKPSWPAVDVDSLRLGVVCFEGYTYTGPLRC